jgi:FtsH-binding integral membrane protein
MERKQGGHGATRNEMMRKHYLGLGLNLVTSSIIMYLVMFAMIYSFRDFFHNVNMLYMAVMMVSPMAILMLLMMGAMYPNKRLNLVLHIGFALLFLLAYLGIRTQAAVGDHQFLRSMIPHHSSAILMCERASIDDPEIQSLCARIIRSQQQEIDQMKAILGRL